MKKGYLSEYFAGVAAKRLSAVEADETRSHQHEYNATRAMLDFMGRPDEKAQVPARFIYLNDSDSEPIQEDAYLTLYDSRKRKRDKRSPEYRFYFPTTQVSVCASEGDLLIVALRRDSSLLVVIAEGGSTVANQLLWLFGLSDLAHPGFSVIGELESDQVKLEFASRFILDQIGVEVEDTDENYLEIMLRMFGESFPKTREFSAFARGTLKDLAPQDDPDAVLLAWLEREEVLFRTFEKYLIGDRLKQGFSSDEVDAFIDFSLSVQNRRKSRAGNALQNHLTEIFAAQGIRHSTQAKTENKSKPDFLFPGGAEYHDAAFDATLLTMLAAKSSCKERWRQVLAEARRIEHKHLLTLEPGISEPQTQEMQYSKLQLVLPMGLHETYSVAQQKWLMSVSGFVALVAGRQTAAKA